MCLILGNPHPTILTPHVLSDGNVEWCSLYLYRVVFELVFDLVFYFELVLTRGVCVIILLYIILYIIRILLYIIIHILIISYLISYILLTISYTILSFSFCSSFHLLLLFRSPLSNHLPPQYSSNNLSKQLSMNIKRNTHLSHG